MALNPEIMKCVKKELKTIREKIEERKIDIHGRNYLAIEPKEIKHIFEVIDTQLNVMIRQDEAIQSYQECEKDLAEFIETMLAVFALRWGIFL